MGFIFYYASSRYSLSALWPRIPLISTIFSFFRSLVPYVRFALGLTAEVSFFHFACPLQHILKIHLGQWSYLRHKLASLSTLLLESFYCEYPSLSIEVRNHSRRIFFSTIKVHSHIPLKSGVRVNTGRAAMLRVSTTYYAIDRILP